MVAVIGAGPAGSYYASKLGEDAHLFEEHKEVGKPVACTGILTESVAEVAKLPKDIVVSHIEAFRIQSPNGKKLYVPVKHKNRIFDRAALDQHLYNKAVDAGANVHLGERFLGFEKKDNKYHFKTTKKTYATDRLVGADGPFSPVAKAAGFLKPRQYRFGWQVRCKYPDLEEGVTEVRLDLGEFSWVVPEDDKIARVGLVGMDMQTLKQDYKTLLGNAEIIEQQSGPIPVYNPRQPLTKENIHILGDAASMVKATTHGGILFGLNAADLLAKNPVTYQKEFNKTFGKELNLSLQIRKLMNAMSNEQINKMVEIFTTKRNNDILATFDRDYPSKFIYKLAFMEPRLWTLGLGVLKNYLIGRSSS